MKLISWNVNGLRACMNKGFQDFLAASGADIFCVQETKMQKGQAEFDFSGYEEYWKCRKCHKFFSDADGNTGIGDPVKLPA